MFKNVLIRLILVGFGLMGFSFPAFGAWSNTGWASCGTPNIPDCPNTHLPWRIIAIGECSQNRGTHYMCQRWISSEPPCPIGQTWDQSIQQCVPDDDPLECQYAGAIPHPSGEGCYCPPPQIEGLKNIGGTLQPSCIDPFPPEDEDPDDPEQPCPAGSHPVQFGDNFFCWEEPEPNPCPEGSLPYTQDGVDQCWTPDENSGDCPDGYYKVGYGGQELCLMPTPNIDDPNNPGPGPGPGDVTVNVQVDFDDSRIVSRLDQTNAKLDQIGTKLDHGNSKLDSIDETLGDLKDALDGPAQPMPGHSQSSAQTFGEANANFLARVNSSALVGAMNSIKNLISVSSSECPSLEFDLNGPIDVSVDSGFHCTMWAQYVAPVFSIIMYVLYIWVAFRVFGSA